MKIILKPVEGEDDGNRVNRGGSWYYAARYTRVSFRGFDPSNRGSYLGFRLTRNVK
mgnify:CR=1 FL=1